MKRFSGPRKTTNLSESTHQQLNMYAIAAGAAGVGVLALAQPVEAKIVYTAANTPISGLVSLDLNNDGIPDFGLCITSQSNTCHEPHPPRGAQQRDFNVFPAKAESQQNQIYASQGWAAALRAGFRIGHKRNFQPGYRLMVTWTTASGHSLYGGPWANVTHRYLGLKFIINGKVHYGWARLKVQGGAIDATLTGYAYETVPGKSIIAGKTKDPADDPINEDSGPGVSLTNPIPDALHSTSLGTLAMGSPGLSIWRRKENESVVHGE